MVDIIEDKDLTPEDINSQDKHNPENVAMPEVITYE